MPEFCVKRGESTIVKKAIFLEKINELEALKDMVGDSVDGKDGANMHLEKSVQQPTLGFNDSEKIKFPLRNFAKFKYGIRVKVLKDVWKDKVIVKIGPTCNWRSHSNSRRVPSHRGTSPSVCRYDLCRSLYGGPANSYRWRWLPNSHSNARRPCGGCGKR
jgi:hypothetical protein